MSAQDLWQGVLAQLELNISPANFATWFKNTRAEQEEEGKLIVATPNSFVKEWLESKYKKDVLRIINSLEPLLKEVEFIVGTDLNFSETKTVKFDRDEFAPQQRLRVFQTDQKTGLNSNYTFENFVVGGFNELAHAAASAVSENPGSLYNPLFLYGRVGLGKTHLLQAIGNKILSGFPEKKIQYVPAERFVSKIISSIQDGTIASLKEDYQQIDTLIIDDVQFLSGKEKTQEEFFHIFNALHRKGKQIVLSSDRPPKAIQSLARRLSSRFEGGMIADISHPDLETRIAILKTKAREKEEDLPQEIYEFLSQNIKTNIRELEGSLNRILLFKKIRKEELTIEKVQELVKDFIAGSKTKITTQNILETVAEFYNIPIKDILSPSRKKEVVRPRQVAMYLMREKLNTSYPAIARKIGGKDHTTVIYACDKIKKKLERDENIKQDIRLLEIRFRNV